jgi:hypothetical protein
MHLAAVATVRVLVSHGDMHCLCVSSSTSPSFILSRPQLTSPLFVISVHVLRDSISISCWGGQRRPGSWRRFTYSGSTAFASYGGVAATKCEEQHDVGDLQVAMWKAELKIADAIRSGGLIQASVSVTSYCRCRCLFGFRSARSTSFLFPFFSFV